MITMDKILISKDSFMVSILLLMDWIQEYKDCTPRVIAQKVKFSDEDFFSKCEQIHSFLRICSHLIKKFLTENFIFCTALASTESV